MQWVLWLLILFGNEDLEWKRIERFKTEKECLRRFHPSLYVSYTAPNKRGAEQFLLICRKENTNGRRNSRG